MGAHLLGMELMTTRSEVENPHVVRKSSQVRLVNRDILVADPCGAVLFVIIANKNFSVGIAFAGAGAENVLRDDAIALNRNLAPSMYHRELIDLRVTGSDRCTTLTTAEYSRVIVMLAGLLAEDTSLETWDEIIRNAKALIERNNHALWYSVIIDSLCEVYGYHGFTKLILATLLNGEGRLDRWIQDYLEFCVRNGQDCGINVCAGDTTALISVAEGSKELVSALLIAGADANIANSEGDTPLIFAAACGNVEVMKLLLGKCALIDTENAKGFTALHIAVSAEQSEAVDLLLSHGAQREICERKTHMTPLLTAICRRAPNIVDALLKAGANPNVKLNSNNSALMFAITHCGTAANSGRLRIESEVEKSAQIIGLLLNDRRTEADWANSKGRTALQLARVYGLESAVALLNERVK